LFHLGFSEDPKQFASFSSFVSSQTFQNKSPFDSFQPIKMAKKTTTKGAGFGGTHDDESKSKEANENFSFDVGTAVWVKDANHAWVAASISKVVSGDLSSGEGTSSFECTFAEDEDDGRKEKKNNNTNGGNGGGKGGGYGGDLSLASAQPRRSLSPKKTRKKISPCENKTRKRTW